MKAVLFDFDFTLVDSSRGVLECIGYALEKEGLPVPGPRAVLCTVGLPLKESFEALAPGAEPEILARWFIERANSVMAELTDFYAPAPPAIGELKAKGYSAGIVSTKYRSRIEEILRLRKMDEAFDVIVGGEDVAFPKPHPEGLLKAMALLHCDRSEAVFVGDTVIDADTAAAADVPFIGVCTGTTSRGELLSRGAIAVLDSLDGLVAALERRATVA